MDDNDFDISNDDQDKYNFLERDSGKKRANWKARLVFILVTIVAIGLIAYGLWLPTQLDFLSQ